MEPYTARTPHMHGALLRDPGFDLSHAPLAGPAAWTMPETSKNAATQNSHRGRTPHSVPQLANFRRNRSHIYGAMGQFKPKTCTPLTQRGAGFGLNSNNTFFARKRFQKQQMSEQPLQKTELSEDTTRATNQRKGHQCCAEVSFFLVRPPPLEPSIPPPLILY